MLVVGVALVNTPPGQALSTQQLTGPRGFADMAWRLCCSLVQGLLHLSELWGHRQDVGPKVVPSLVPLSGVGTAQPQTSFHTGLVQLVSATVPGKAQASSGYLFKASFRQLFGALKSHISTPGDAGAQPSLSQRIPGCSPPPTSSSPGCFHPRAPLTQGADSIHNHLGQNAPK